VLTDVYSGRTSDSDSTLAKVGPAAQEKLKELLVVA
jgi:hypothetical protein